VDAREERAQRECVGRFRAVFGAWVILLGLAWLALTFARARTLPTNSSDDAAHPTMAL
jgi:hypothetical protein